MRQQVEFAEIQNEFGNLAEELLNVKLVNNDLKKQMKEDNDKIILLVKGIESLQKQVSLICLKLYFKTKVLSMQYIAYRVRRERSKIYRCATFMFAMSQKSKLVYP